MRAISPKSAEKNSRDRSREIGTGDEAAWYIFLLPQAALFRPEKNEFMKYKNLLILSLSCLSICGCVPNRKIVYMQDLKSKDVVAGNRFTAVGKVVNNFIAAFSENNQLCILF